MMASRAVFLAPALFGLLFAEMLLATLYMKNAGVKIKYRTDGTFFDLPVSER